MLKYVFVVSWLIERAPARVFLLCSCLKYWFTVSQPSAQDIDHWVHVPNTPRRFDTVSVSGLSHSPDVPFFPILLCFSFPVLQRALCRHVAVPAGPLYRVAGSPLSLPCAVSGYEGSRTQDFEWFLFRDDAAGRQMGVVSTRDKGFPYAPFQARVTSGEVRVERDSGDKVRLIIQRLRPDDQGKYECYTPSTDSSYQGNYSATVAVKGKTWADSKFLQVYKKLPLLYLIYSCHCQQMSVPKLIVSYQRCHTHCIC